MADANDGEAEGGRQPDPPSSAGGAWRWLRLSWSTVWIVAAFVLVCWVHLWRLGTEGVVTDENAYRRAGSQYVQGVFRVNLEHPPLAKELIGSAEVLFGRSWTAVRLPSALAGIATAAVLCAWATRAAGPWAGLAAVVLWGLVPQRAGLPGLLDLSIPTRVDRFALLEPLATLFSALALWAGWEWMTRRTLRWAVVAGLATGFAAAAKAPGVLVAPAIVGFAISAGLGAAAIAYAPFGFHAAFHQLDYMFAFQSRHAQEGHSIYLAGKIYSHPPWWAGLSFQTLGYGWAITVAGAGAIAAALFAARHRSGVAYALAAAVSVYVVLNLAVGLQLSFYYLLWQPALVFAAAMGVEALLRGGRERLLLLPLGGLVLVPVVAFGVRLATLGPGPYERAAELAACGRRCVANVVGYPGVLKDYLPPGAVVRAGLPRDGLPPDLVVADPSLTIRRPDLAVAVDEWLAMAVGLGYRHVTLDGLDVWVLPPA